MDLGAPVYLHDYFVIGFVSYIPKGDQKGKPIIVTDMMTVTTFIYENTRVKGVWKP